MPRIAVVGSINMDLVARVQRLPAPGETLIGRDLTFIPGGKGANQAVAAVRLGAHTSMCGRLGDDAFGVTLRSALCDADVNTDAVATTPGISSGVAWIGVDAAGTNSITVIPGANGLVTDVDVAAWTPVLTAADVILLQLEIPLEAVAAVIRLARAHRIRTVLDVAPVPTSSLPDEFWTADIVSPNQAEAEALTGICVDSLDAAKAAASALRRRGALCVVLKLGEMGALVDTEVTGPIAISAFAIEPVDTTAAGDAFTGALAVAWAEGQSLVDATRFACAAGACACERFGAQPAMPTRAEVQARMVR